jgi:antitoxin component YwqK of YwqJK toxin-antitoxin module
VARCYVGLVVLTAAAAYGSGACGTPAGAPSTTATTETTKVVATVPIDAAPPDAPPPPRLACESGTAITPGPAPEPTFYCARPDGTRDGPFVETFPDGTIDVAGSYKDGKLDGPWERHHDNGQLAEDGKYAAGLKDGHWRQLGPDGALLGDYELAAGTGTEKRWYDEGGLYREVMLKDGLANGPAKTYLPDGTIVINERFARGKLDGARQSGTKLTMFITETYGKGTRYGERKIWQFGLLKYEEQFDYGGHLDGPYTIWHDPKVARVKGQFKHGRRDGHWVWWDSGNNKEMEGSYDVGKKDGEWNEWSENKPTFNGTYKDGRPDGTFTWWERNGSEIGSFEMKDGTGVWTTFHPNNHTAASKERLYKGERDGVYQELTATKKVVVEGHYSGGIKHGSWKEWTPEGVPLVDKTWKFGKLDGPWKKYVDGKVAVETTYKAGKVDGAYTEYRAGKKSLTGQFADDRRDGTWTTYDANGNVMATATYKAGVLDGPWHELVDGAVYDGQMEAGRRAGTWTRTDRSGHVDKQIYALK